MTVNGHNQTFLLKQSSVLQLVCIIDVETQEIGTRQRTKGKVQVF